MFEGIILGFLTFISFVISFIKLPKDIQDWLLKHKVITDLGAAALCFLLISSITKSIVGLFASMFAGLAVGISVEVAEMAAQDPEIRAKIQNVKKNFIVRAKDKLRETVLKMPDGTDAT